MERSKGLPEYSTEIVSADEQEQMAGPLEALVQSVGWPIYAELLMRARIQSRETLEAAETLADMNYTRGLIAGLKYAQELPLMVLQEALKAAKAETVRSAVIRGEVFRATGEESF